MDHHVQCSVKNYVVSFSHARRVGGWLMGSKKGMATKSHARRTIWKAKKL